MALNLTGISNVDMEEPELRARITVFGVGGAGGNAVNNMIEKQLAGVEFIAANTDAQALANSRASRKIQMGSGVTRGLGAGSKPEVGLHAAEETIEEIAAQLEGSHMCFITAGMGGGTGTGAAPVVARAAREMGILTVGVVTKPFHFEGARRMKIAEMGVDEMQSVVDTLIVIPNQNLFQVASERTTFVEAFMMADDVLYQGVQGVTDLMVRPGMINLDFADVRSVMEEMGKAMMGTGEADGDTRAIDAAEKAIANPLLDEVSLKGARGVLINITGGYDLTLFEMDEAANRIKEEVDPDAMIKFGSAIDPDMEGRMRVSVVATGIEAENVTNRNPIVPGNRKPATTDPEMLAAVQGTARRTEPAASEPTSPGKAAVARIRADAAQRSAEKEPAPTAQPETASASQPNTHQATATGPTPSDIRARAEAVRQRAKATQVQNQANRASQGVDIDDDDPVLFELDDASLEPSPPAPSRQNSLRADAPSTHRPATGNTASPTTAHRPGLFTINRLINRVAGTGQGQNHSEPAPEQPRMQRDDLSDEIPAFLRRQAN